MKRLSVISMLLLASCGGPQVIYNGTIDDVNCGRIVGWAYDWNRLAIPIEIRIHDEAGGEMKAVAKLVRPDLPAGGQNHAFIVPVPDFLRDGKPHLVHVNFENSLLELRNSPRPLVCPAMK